MSTTNLYGLIFRDDQLSRRSMAIAIGLATASTLNAAIISRQPTSQVIPVGQAASFSVQIAPGTSARYQWQKNETDIVGATNPTYSIGSVSSNDAANYSVLINDSTNVTKSAPAMLVVGTNRVVYVNGTAVGANNGTTWINAYTNLNSALNSSKNGDAIWVSSGDQTATFTITNFVTLVGGFSGIETNSSSRNYNSNTTTLSGFLPGGGRTHQIVTIKSGSIVTLDGFTVTGGNCPTPGVSPDSGGGIIQQAGSSLSVFNSSFISNTAVSYGGACCLNGYATFGNCRFLNNSAPYNGGGAIQNSTYALIVTNCYFSGNSASRGGTMELQNGAAAYIADSVFVGNYAGGGLGYSDQLGVIRNWGSGATLAVVNSTFLSNSFTSYNSNSAVINAQSTNSIIANNIFSINNGMTPVNPVAIIIGNLSDITITNSGNLHASVIFRNPGNILGADGVLGTADDGLYLVTNSPGIGAGNTNYAPATDITGKLRNASLGIDVGAYDIHAISGLRQTITFPPLPPKTYWYGMYPITLAATDDSGLPITYSIVSGPGTISGNQLTVNGAGTIVVQASQAGNGIYQAAQTNQSLVINQGNNRIYPSITLGAFGSSGLPVTFTVNSGPATVSGSTLNVTGTGTIVLQADQSGNQNYKAATPIRASLIITNLPTQ
jgi:hypothetical protein